MEKEHTVSLREYLRLQRVQTKNLPIDDVYDEFLLQVWDLFELRAMAEEGFRLRKFRAKTPRGALPIDWCEVKKIFDKTSDPPVQLITIIARENAQDVVELMTNLRKVLSRVREKVLLGQIQQMDSHCLRWLVRQPGRTAAEKAGAQQTILGVVRVENFDTLENRVLKDFLKRGLVLATCYLRQYGGRQHDIIDKVRRFKNLCQAGLEHEILKDVRNINELPMPNYVLQQDRLYSRIWRSYYKILQQEDIAEKLWNVREEVDACYQKCRENVAVHCSPNARYCMPLWINSLDGRAAIFENPIWRNELADRKVESPNPFIREDDVQVVDLTHPWGKRNKLIYPTHHSNARPFLQNPYQPSLEEGDEVELADILEKRDKQRLADYFRALYGVLGGKRWIVLVPDDWDAKWLEIVARQLPPEMPRSRVFFLWRSVAAALGLMWKGDKFKEGDRVVVVDGFSATQYNAVELRFRHNSETHEVLPQRASPRLHNVDNPNCQDARFCLRKSIEEKEENFRIGQGAVRVCVGMLTETKFLPRSEEVYYDDANILFEKGIEQYLLKERIGEVAYFDERDALSLVVQTRAEEVCFKTLVTHDECSPGGMEYKGEKVSGGVLSSAAKILSLYLLEGETSDRAFLKKSETDFDEAHKQESEIFLTATLTPGQGLAQVEVVSEVLKKSLRLDLVEMKDSDYTKARIEREMKRHFPPVMPFVEACDEMWNAPAAYGCTIGEIVQNYIGGGVLPSRDTFAHAQPYWKDVGSQNNYTYFFTLGPARTFDDKTMSPVDRLKRENVFGNDPSHREPCVKGVDWGKLFKKLAADYRKNPNDVLRLIAWSYRYDLSCFEFIRKEKYEKYVKDHQALDACEITFCANNFPSEDSRISEILREVLLRIGQGKNGVDELRLAYNLMQFHPLALAEIETKVCEDAMKKLVCGYHKNYSVWRANGRWAGANATQAVGYYIKCMLFLLHKRRSDPKFFYRPPDWEPSKNHHLGEALPTNTPALVVHEQTRKAFIQYVRGEGTIEGIPMGD